MQEGVSTGDLNSGMPNNTGSKTSNNSVISSSSESKLLLKNKKNLNSEYFQYSP
jgi:hypothetical protein